MGKINRPLMLDTLEQVKTILARYSLDDFYVALEHNQEQSFKDDGRSHIRLDKEQLGLGVLLVKKDQVVYKGSFDVSEAGIRNTINEALKNINKVGIRERVYGIPILSREERKEVNSIYHDKTTFYTMNRKRTYMLLSKDNQLIVDERSYGSVSCEIVTKERQIERSKGWSGTGQNIHIVMEKLNNEVKELSHCFKRSVPAMIGFFPVVFSPIAAGMVLHEVVHFFEADQSNYLEKDQIVNDRVNLNILDDPSLEGYFGSQIYDDEGIKTKPKYLIKSGRIINFLTSRFIPKIMNQSNGHARSQDIRFMPRPRMNNILLESGEFNERELIEGIKSGYYIVRISAGYANKKNGDIVLRAEEAYSIRNGKVKEPVFPFILRCNVKEFISNIFALGKYVNTISVFCKCKSGDIPVSLTQPSMRVEKVNIVKGMIS